MKDQDKLKPVEHLSAEVAKLLKPCEMLAKKSQTPASTERNPVEFLDTSKAQSSQAVVQAVPLLKDIVNACEAFVNQSTHSNTAERDSTPSQDIS